MNRHFQIEGSCRRRYRTVQIHIHKRRIDMEILHRQHAVLHRIVAFHAGEQIAVVAAPVGADIADDRRIVQCARDRDDIVDIAGDRLIRRHQRSKILQPRADRVNLKIDAAFPGEADDALDQPRHMTSVFHRERIDPHSVETAGRFAVQRPIRLPEQVAVDCRKIRLHCRIVDRTTHRTVRVPKSRHIENRIDARKQAKIHMRRIISEIQ